MKKHTRQFLTEYHKPSLNLPPELKEYTIETLLSESTNGATYRLLGRDGVRTVLKVRPLAMKELLAAEAQILQSLEAGKRMAPRLYLSFTDEQHAYLMREFIEGVTLYDYMEAHGCLPEDRILSIGQALCQCTSRLQEQIPPVIHRDIKPQNCILTPEGEVRLIDFDTARTYKDKQACDTRFMGTKATAAPEQYGFAQSDVRTDIYGIGKTLIFLATGSYDVTALKETSLDSRLKKLLQQSVSIRKDDRPKDAQTFARSLERIRRDPHFCIQKRLLFFATTAFTLFLCLTAILFWQQHQRQVVSFESDLMSEAVHTSLGIPSDAEVLYRDLKNITELGVVGMQVLAPGSQFAYFSDEGLGHNGEVRPEAFDESGTITDLSLLSYMTNLKCLYLCHQPLSDIRALSKLELHTLALTNCKITDFSPLSNIKTLRKLYVSGNPARSLSFLLGNKNLEYLAIGDATYDSLAPLTDLNLSHIHISRMDVLDDDLTPLSRLPALEMLSGANVTKRQLAAFANSPTLYNIDLWNEMLYDDLTLLGEMPRLRELSIYGLNTLNGIENLPQLDYLYLGPPRPDLSELAKAKSLLTIDISPLDITDYTPLFAAPRLTLILARSDQEKGLRAAIPKGCPVKIEYVQ